MWTRFVAALLFGYRVVAFYVVIAAFGVVFLGWNLVALVLGWVLRPRSAAVVGQYGIMRGFRVLLWLMGVAGLATFDLSSLDALRDEPGVVIAPNHPSLLDVLLVISRLPRVVCIAKASLWRNPALGAASRLAGYIRNDQSQHHLIRRAVDALGANQQLLIFPEGTRTPRGQAIGPIKGGFALMARRAGVPVQTVLLESDTRYLSKGWGVMRRPPLPGAYRARLGKRFVVAGKVDEFVAELDAYFRSELEPRD